MAAQDQSSSKLEELSPSLSPPQDHHTNALPRTRSIQFSSPTRKRQMSDTVSPTEQSHEQHQAESSADEITPIFGKERGSTKSKCYRATSSAKISSSDNGIQISRRNSASTARRRTEEPRIQDDSEGEDQNGRGRAWRWKDLVEKYGSVELDNKGSVARDHLALERTFLAWLRTSLAFASIGIAVTQLFRLNTTISKREGLQPNDPGDKPHLRQVGKPLGATFLGIAVLVLLVGGRRYFESQYWIIRGKFPASRGSIFLVTFVALTLIITSLVIVCVIDPSVFEKK